MASLQNTYAKQVRDGLKWGATWPPQTRVAVGDVGEFVDGIFVKATDLELLKIAFETEDGAYETDMHFSSERGVEVSTKLSGATSKAFSALAEADAGFAISFKRSGGIAMAMSGISGERIRDRRSLEGLLLDRFNRGEWPEEYAVIVDCLKAETATILISRKAGTRVELQTTAKLPGGAAAIGALSGGVSLAYADAMSQLIIAKQGLTPLFHSVRLKRDIWRGETRTVYHREESEEVGDEDMPVPQLPENDALEDIDFDPDS